MTDLNKLAHELGEAIEASDEFKKYAEAKALQETDSELQMFIGEYNLRRMQLMTELQKNAEDQDEEMLNSMRDTMNAAYDKVISHPVMKQFSDASEALQEMVNGVYQIINFHVTGEEPHSCGGNCSGCSGCH
ncbi:MAG: YlbF family regulator [Clostridia bacterium]|nr:YlbF family regulator [Clostridia bacterium]